MFDKSGFKEMKLYKNLKTMMIAKSLSLKKLSVDVGIPPSTIHGWLNGAAPKSIIDLKKVADFFGVSIDELCFGVGDKCFDSIVENVVAELGNIQLIMRRKD